mmetsp:Transcript_27836/g.69960  ORF Transcript_27836/g.69960 Transcript_27836/m.69960 type:complete len:298 (+) Transcript_27836:1849-2742(+)
MTWICISSVRIPHESPMLMAVSCLSPVRTQILTPASSSVRSVSGTPSCSLSSMPVIPSRRRSDSMISTAASIAASASSPTVPRAASYFSIQSSRNFSSKSRYASTSVRRPPAANDSRTASVSSTLPWSSVQSRGKMTESAPLQYSRVFFTPDASGLVVCMMTDMRFLEELNWMVWRTSHSSEPPVGRPRVMVTEERALNSMPAIFEALTSAASSGLVALYETSPSSLVSSWTVWQSARRRKNSAHAEKCALSAAEACPGPPMESSLRSSAGRTEMAEVFEMLGEPVGSSPVSGLPSS